ncbi:MAG: MATE family efflux transporter, partial [Pseudomonadota bacterium]|nr:MATE family efflux transporter [Pseudomonadota bacterium]
MDTNPTSSPLPPEVLGGRDGWRGEFAATLRLSWPLAAANLLQMLTYAVDVIFIARLGEAQLAASALAVALFGLVLWAMSGL